MQIALERCFENSGGVYKVINKDINLLPQEVVGEQKARKIKRLGVLVYILIVTAMFSYILIPLNYTIELNSKKESLTRSIKVAESIIVKENELNDINKTLSLRKMILEKSQSERLDLLNILEKIETFIPQGITLGSVDATENSIVLVGSAGNDIIIADFIEQMKKSEIFSEIFVPGIVRRTRAGENSEYTPYDFSMECKLKK